MVIVGGSPSALTVTYFLQRTSLSVVILHNGEGSGGAWVHGWDSLRLFSLAQWSSLPGRGMPATEGYPTRDDIVNYLAQYEKRYDLVACCSSVPQPNGKRSTRHSALFPEV